MTREHQFTLFHRYFDAENERYESLTTRASIYLSIISALALFAGVKVKQVDKVIAADPIALLLTGLSGVCVLACIAVTVWSLRVYPYKDICDVEELVVEIDEKGYETEDVYSVLLANLADATAVNRRNNDHRARCLQWAASFLGVAVAVLILVQAVVVIPILRGGIHVGKGQAAATTPGN